MKLTKLAVYALGVALVASPAIAADPSVTFCEEELSQVLSLHGMTVEDLENVQQIKVGMNQPSIVTIAKPKSCEAGEVRISMWYTCTLQNITTVGDCRIAGVPHAPF